MGAIAFKEWQVVCDALASGRQSLILRKGGIHEGRAGFSFAHNAFFLFPTRFHAQGSLVRDGQVTALPEWQVGEPVRLTHHVNVLRAVTLDHWETVTSLEPFHIHTESNLRERFDWQGKGMTSGSIHVALVQVHALARPWEFSYVASFGGCRSWIDLPDPPANCLEDAKPVLDSRAIDALLNHPAFADQD
jgi:hypothetical protein